MGKKLLGLCLAAGILLALFSCEASRNERTQIAVIVKATDSDFWQKVRDGVNAASIEYNIAVTFDGAESEEDYEEQNRLIQKAIDDNADAIVLSAISYDGSTAYVDKAASRGIKIVTIDSNTSSEAVSLFIGTDNRDAGKQAAQAAVKDFPPVSEIRIGLVGLYESTENGRQREEGFREELKNVPNARIVASVNVASDTESATEGALSLLKNHPEINVLVGFNEWMTLGVGNAIDARGLADSVRGIGFDTNEKCIAMLEDGILDALVAQNPFAIGYLGVKAANDLVADSLAYGDQKEEYTAVTVVTTENLDDRDVQKILFRFR